MGKKIIFVGEFRTSEKLDSLEILGLHFFFNCNNLLELVTKKIFFLILYYAWGPCWHFILHPCKIRLKELPDIDM